MKETLYSWEFKDNKNRGNLWYIIAISIVIGTSIWGFLTEQYGLSFIVLLISGLYYFIENNSSDNIKTKILSDGIDINDVFYNYSNIINYSIVYKGEEPVLLRINLNKKGLRYIDLKISNENLDQIRYNLSEFLEETKKIDLSMSEKMIGTLKL